MITSMTGFANYAVVLLEQGDEQCVLDIEIKTFNSRFFEPTCKLPGVLGAYEMDVINRLKKSLVRGRVYCSVRVSGYSSLLEKQQFSSQRVTEYLQTAAILQDKFGVKGELQLHHVLAFPNLFVTERTVLSDDTIARFLKGIDTALEQVQISRRREGESLEADLRARFAKSATLIVDIEEATRQALVVQKERLSALQKRAQEGDEEAKVLVTDMYSTIDRMDVHEEVVRFNAHLSAIAGHFSTESDEKGRKFDFILQELVREINTIMSKCSSYNISAHGVDVKVELEKAREQVQNIV